LSTTSGSEVLAAFGSRLAGSAASFASATLSPGTPSRKPRSAPVWKYALSTMCCG
jgi:hypothetical protein